MTKGLLTQFSTVTVLHMALLFGGALLVQTGLQKNNVPKLGNGGAIQISLGGAPKKMTSPVAQAPKTKMVATSSPVKMPARPVEVAKSQTSESSQGTSGNVAGTGGSPNGHALGSGSTGTGTFDTVSLYKAELRAAIDKNKSYPTMSKRLGQTGTVVVAFTLLPDGRITNVRIDKPSQFDRLNASALEAVKKVERFKPIPKEAGEEKMDITVPLKFVTI